MFPTYTLTRSFAGMDFVETLQATALDWSGCRSPSRARRRHAKGFPQRVRHVPACYKIDGVLHIHPEMARQIRQNCQARLQDSVDRVLFGPQAFKAG